MGDIPRLNVPLILSFLLLLLFVWVQVLSIDNSLFLGLLYFSFVFLGLATFLLVSSNIEQASKRTFYAVTLITIVTTIIVASTIAMVPRGGARHDFSTRPPDFEMAMKYESWMPGYYGGWEQSILNADYSVGGVFIDYFLDFANVFVNKSVSLNGKLWVSLYLLPNHVLSFYPVVKMAEGTFTLNGSESGVILEPSHWLSIFWGGYDSNQRIRIDKGYSVVLSVTVELEGSDYGDIEVFIPLNPDSYPSIHIDDVEVTSQLQDGIAILLSGVLAGIQSQVLAKPLMRFLKERRSSVTKQTSSS